MVENLLFNDSRSPGFCRFPALVSLLLLLRIDLIVSAKEAAML